MPRRPTVAALLGLALATAFPVAAQTAVLRGRVVDATSRSALAGADVVAGETGVRTLTDADGSTLLPSFGFSIEF